MNTFAKLAAVVLVSGISFAGICTASPVANKINPVHVAAGSLKAGSESAFPVSSDPADARFNGILPQKVNAVPEPKTYLEIVIGGVILLVFIQRRKSKVA